MPPRATSQEKMRAFIDSLWALGLPFIIIFGLKFGIFTPTEAGVVAAVYSLFVATVIYRELKLGDLYPVFLTAAKVTAVVMFLVAITQVSAPIDADLASVSDPIAGIVLMAMAAFAPYLTYKFIAFVGFDMYHAIGSEQDAKSALNRPIPVPTKPQGGGDPKKVLEATSTATFSAPGEYWLRAEPVEADDGFDGLCCFTFALVKVTVK